MKVLITGINGFAGCHLSMLLSRKGHEVLGTRIDELNLDIITKYVSLDDIFTVDLNDREHLDELIGSTKPEAVFHLAGQSWVPASWKDPASTFEVNLIGSINVFDSIVKHVPESRCVYISTGNFYDVSASPDKAADEVPVHERDFRTQGLALPADVLEKLYAGNAKRWIPGL